MRKNRLLIIPTIILFMLILSNVSFSAVTMGYRWGLAKMDSVLVELLSISYNDPFWTPAIRQDYLKLGLKSVSSVVAICPLETLITFTPGNSKINLYAHHVVKLTPVIRWAGTDSAYSLIGIKSSDVGQKEIATSVPARYYYLEELSAEQYIYIYPPDLSDTVRITLYGYRTTYDFTLIRAIANHIILEYALYWCYLQKGETDIARAKKEWADILLYDLKNVLENRPIDITLKEKVLSK